MPLILWFLSVPLGLIVVLYLMHRDLDPCGDARVPLRRVAGSARRPRPAKQGSPTGSRTKGCAS
jgi:hypothetical protein